jgi:hypothetical protein
VALAGVEVAGVDVAGGLLDGTADVGEPGVELVVPGVGVDPLGLGVGETEAGGFR